MVGFNRPRLLWGVFLGMTPVEQSDEGAFIGLDFSYGQRDIRSQSSCLTRIGEGIEIDFANKLTSGTIVREIVSTMRTKSRHLGPTRTNSDSTTHHPQLP